MTKDVFDYVLEHIETDDTRIWPLEIHDILDTLAAEEPLKGSHKYIDFLKGKITLVTL
jgi:hypothetical protein